MLIGRRRQHQLGHVGAVSRLGQEAVCGCGVLFARKERLAKASVGNRSYCSQCKLSILNVSLLLMGEGPPRRYPGAPKSRISALPDSLLPNISRPVRPSLVQAIRLKPAARRVDVALHGGDHLIANVGAFLNSLCGHRMSTRFLILQLSPERIRACDAEAIKLLKMCHGVNGVDLAPYHADFPKGQRFNFIFASSVFLQIPRSGLGRGLRR